MWTERGNEKINVSLSLINKEKRKASVCDGHSNGHEATVFFDGESTANKPSGWGWG
jgi:hypothetical protein